MGLFYEADKTFEQLMDEKKNFVFIGEAGSGKSEIVLNIANKLAERTGRQVDLFDLDQTKPLYRSRDMQEDFEKRGGGYIMNTASSAGFFAGPMFASYYATKAYVLRMSQAVNEELRHKRSGVNLSVLCPGPVETEFMEKSGSRFSVPPQSSGEVAEYAVREMFGGRFLLLPSLTDKASALMGKLIPDSISAYAVRLIQSRREEQ